MDDGHNPDCDGSQKIRDVYAVKLDLTHSHRTHCPAAMAERPHLFPCRTQQLSSPAPMVVGLTSRKSRTLPGSTYSIWMRCAALRPVEVSFFCYIISTFG